MTIHLLVCTVVALIAVALSAWACPRSGALRHAILFAALLRFTIPTVWLTNAGTMVRHLSGYAPAHALIEESNLRGPRSVAIAIATSAPRVLTNNIWPFWGLGVLASLAVWARRLCINAPEVRSPNAVETHAFDQARRDLGAGAGVTLCIVGSDHGPAVRGWWRHTVLLPDGLRNELSTPELQAVIAHELAHSRRRDNLSAAIARMIASIFWFNPVVWWLERRMLNERELACDELVLAHGARAEDYTAAILKVCRMSFAATTGYAGAAGSDLRHRMEHIMSVKNSRIMSMTQLAPLGALATIALLIPVAGGFLKAQTAVPPTKAETRRLVTEAEDLMKQGKTDDGIRMLQTEVENNPDRPELRLALGNYAVRAGRFDLAITTFEQLLDGMDRNSKAAVDIELRLGETCRRKGDLVAAISTLQQAHAADPTNGLVLRTLALTLDSAGRKVEAKTAYRSAVELDPKDGVSLNNLAYLLSQTGVDDKEALAYAERAVKAMPGVYEASDTLAWVYLTQKQITPALAILNNIVSTAPENSEYRYHLGLALLQTGDRFAARQAFQKALEGNPSPELQQSIRKSLSSLDQ